MTALRYAARAAVRALLARAAQQWRRTLWARAADVADLMRGRRLMVLAPHPDDETLGCGAVIARARDAGDQVTVVVGTDGRHSSRSAVIEPLPLARLRSTELLRACRRLGVDPADVVQLDREDGTLGACRQELADELAALIADRRPQTIFVPCAQDLHPDHQAMHEALRLALRRHHGPQPAVLAYPIWTLVYGPWFLQAGSVQRWPLLGWAVRQLKNRRWVQVQCEGYLEAKRSAIQAYASQTTNLTGEASWSYLSSEAVGLFVQPSEIFLPVADGHRP